MIVDTSSDPSRLAESEERFRTFADESPQLLWMSDERGAIILENEHYKRFFGVETEDMLEEGWRRIVHPEDVDAFHADYIAAIECRRPIRRTVRVIHPELGVRWLTCDGGPRNVSGRFAGLVGLITDITDRVLAEDALRVTERRLEAVLNNASVAIFLMDDRQHCIYMNAAAERLTGYRFEETQGRPLHDVIHHTRPDGTPFPLAECAIDRAFPENNNTQGEEVFVHKDGHFYPVAFTASPVQDQASRTVGTIIEVRDISDEKAAMERQRLLINELNHRVKNTLAGVQSIAYHSFKGADAGAREAFEERLAALSAAHNVLTMEGWTGASLCTAIKTAIAPFDAPGRFELVGDDHALAPTMVVSLSMGFHELATNAAKYGSLSSPAGRVRIEWTVRQDDGDERWEESGGPQVTPPARKGFGTRLLERQIAMEFSGSVKLDHRSAGLVCTMDLRLPSADQSDLVALEAVPRAAV